MKTVFYKTKNGKLPVIKFIDGLSKKDQTRVYACLRSIERLGFTTPRARFRQIKGALWEIKIQLESGGYRFFYVTLKKGVLCVLHGYKKQSQKAPKKEIEVAYHRMLEVIENEISYII